jgi:hypothetical protein
MEFMASINNPREYEHHQSSIINNSEQMRVYTKSLHSKRGAFSGSSSEIPRLDQFKPRIYFLELATKFSYLDHTKDVNLINCLCINGNHQESFFNCVYVRLTFFIRLIIHRNMHVHKHMDSKHII